MFSGNCQSEAKRDTEVVIWLCEVGNIADWFFSCCFLLSAHRWKTCNLRAVAANLSLFSRTMT